jgi:hypothetical protein
MRRFPVTAFLVLVVATIAAFFITQHLKVSTPLIAGLPRPFPPAINPVSGGSCYDPARREEVDYRVMRISFYVLHQSDLVDLYVVDRQGRRVAVLATDRFMPGLPNPVRMLFTWGGRDRSGTVVPNGTYYIQVHLVHQDRNVTISNNSGPLPVTVNTKARCP